MWVVSSRCKCCGLYSKVFKRMTENSNQAENSTINYVQNQLGGLNCIKNLIGENKLLVFKRNSSRERSGQKQDESLFHLWYDLSQAPEPRIEIAGQ